MNARRTLSGFATTFTFCLFFFLPVVSPRQTSHIPLPTSEALAGARVPPTGSTTVEPW